jgi:hypothetical protein
MSRFKRVPSILERCWAWWNTRTCLLGDKLRLILKSLGITGRLPIAPLIQLMILQSFSGVPMVFLHPHLLEQRRTSTSNRLFSADCRITSGRLFGNNLARGLEVDPKPGRHGESLG